MMKTPDLYETLGVPRDATQRDIKAAYRKRAAAAHPDKGGSDAEAQSVNAAYETLGDSEKRARYDATGQVEGVAPAMTPGEMIFLQTLDAVMREVVDDDEGSMTAEISNRLKAKYGDLSREHTNLKDRIARLEQHLGRYISRVTEENLIESHLLATRTKLIELSARMDRDLSAILDAIKVANGYADAAPVEVRYGRSRGRPKFGYQMMGLEEYIRTMHQG
jgi:curved DNA-binding protein CbpA